jgi:hypothetical protein
MLLLILLATLLSEGCATLPPAPNANLCIIDVLASSAYCTDIPSVVSSSSPTIKSIMPLSSLQNGVGFDQNSWAAIQVYIQQLKEQAEKQCNP